MSCAKLHTEKAKRIVYLYMSPSTYEYLTIRLSDFSNDWINQFLNKLNR